MDGVRKSPRRCFEDGAHPSLHHHPESAAACRYRYPSTIAGPRINRRRIFSGSFSAALSLAFAIDRPSLASTIPAYQSLDPIHAPHRAALDFGRLQDFNGAGQLPGAILPGMGLAHVLDRFGQCLIKRALAACVIRR